jgi:quercetin dioxygenase-like cupin family protein
MPVLRAADAAGYDVHGSRFDSYVSPRNGGRELCAWRLSVPAGSLGVPHRPTRDEVLLVLDGRLQVTLDGETSTVGAGDAVLVQSGCELRVDGGTDGGAAWVTTTPGLQAVTADGQRLTPPWAN